VVAAGQESIAGQGAPMRPALRSWRGSRLVLVVLVLARCGSESPLTEQVRTLQQQTCLEHAPHVVSEQRVESGRVTAVWTCSVSKPWSEYLVQLDSIPGYRRRESAATRATYGRSTATDDYVLIVTASPDVPRQVQVVFTAGPF
jgi:hypothetical protein